MTSDKVYRIEENQLCGRQLVAKRKILAGELIIDEPALLAGPGFARGNSSITCQQEAFFNRTSSNERKSRVAGEMVNDFTQEDASVCLVCCVNLNPSSCLHCPSCTLLFCSEYCKCHVQHTQNECIIFPKIRHVWNGKAHRSKKSLYNLVFVIRGLFYKFRDITKWTQINNLESKSEALVKVGGFADLEDVFSFLTWEMFSSSPCSASGNNENTDNHNNDGKQYDSSILEAAQHCLGVMRINAFSSFSESYSREGLFFISSFMSHSCVINTDRQIGVTGLENFRMVVRASVDIEKGEPITTTYLSLLYNTEERHMIMITSWLFVCHCNRCEDPNECMAFSGATICKKDLMASECGLVNVCSHNHQCSCLVNNTGKERTIQKIIKSKPTDLYNTTEVENWLDSNDTGAIIHPHHSLFAHVKLFLCQFYGRQSGGLDTLSINQLKRKVLYCLQILSIFNEVCPGFQICRGVVLFELWCGLSKLYELNELPLAIAYPPGTINSTPTLQNPIMLTETDIFETKKKTLEILQYALPNTPEEAMANCLLEEDRST